MAAEAPIGKKSLVRRVLATVAAVLGLLFVVVLLLPTILSLPPVRIRLFRQIGAQSGITLAADSCSFSWFGGQRLGGFRFMQPGGPAVSARDITVSAGLVRLLSSRRDLGTIEITGLDVAATLPARPAAPDGRKPGTPSPPHPPPAPPPSAPQPLPGDLRAKLLVRNGKATISAPGVNPFVVKDLNLSAEIAGFSSPVTFEASFAQSDSGGTLKTRGAIRPWKDGVWAPDALAGELSVDVAALDLGPLGQLASSLGSMPAVAGVLDSAVSLQLADPRSVHVGGHVSIASLALSGGALGGDKPSFDRVRFDFDLALASNAVEIGRLTLVSPPAEAKVAGRLATEPGKKLPSGSLTAEALIQLPILAAALPETLRLEKGITIASGTIGLTGQVASAAEQLAFSGKLDSREVQAERAGKTIRLEPIHLSTKGSWSEKGIALDDLTLQAPFAAAKGSGNLDNLKFDASLDLDKARAEIQKIVDLGALAASGQVQAALTLTPASDRSRKLSASVDGTNLAIGGFTPQPLREKFVQVRAEGVLDLDERHALRRVTGLAVGLKSSAVTVDVAAREIAPPAAGTALGIAGLTLKAESDLQALLAFCREAGMATNIQAAGSAVVKAEAELRDRVLAIPSVGADLTGLSLAAGKSRIAAVEARLTASASIDAAKKSIAIPTLGGTVASPVLGARLAGEQIVLPQDGAAPSIQSLQIRSQSDLQALGDFCREAGFTPADLGLAGALRAEAHLNLQNGNVAIPSFRADATGLVVRAGQKSLLPSEFRLKGAASLDPAKRRLVLNGVDAQSSFGTLAVSEAVVSDWSNALATATCRASLASDLAGALRHAGGFSPLAAPASLAGQLAADLAMAPGRSGNLETRFSATVAKLAYTSAKGTRFEEPSLRLALDAAAEPGGTNLAVKFLTVGSSLLNLSGAGRLSDLAGAKNLDTRGKIEVDFARVGELARTMTGSKIELDGRASRDFRVTSSLAGADWVAILRKTEAEAGLYLKRFGLMGIETGEVSPALTVSNGVAGVRMTTTVNQGVFTFEPILDARADPAFVTFPPHAAILKDVALSQGLVSELLVKVNPIFQDCSVLGGTIGLTLASARVPVGAGLSEAMSFQGTIEPKGVRLAQGGLIKEVIELCKLDSSAVLVLPDRPIAFACANGRVETAPLVILAGTNALTVSGYMLLAGDGELHYQAEFPVTEKLIGKKNYAKHKDLKLTLPIEGTLKNPKPVSEAITAAVAKLAVDVGTEMLIQEGGKLLEDLFSPRKKDKKK